MRATLQSALEAKQLAYHCLAYAYCKKNPKELGGVTVIPWTEVEEPLIEILEDQILDLLKAEKDDDCYVGRYQGQPVVIDNICPDDFPPEYRTIPVVTLLEQLRQGRSALPVSVADEEPLSALAAHEAAMEMIAWKYLAQDRSQTAVVCLIDFSAMLPVGMQRFIFLTQVDLDERRVEAIIKNGKLTTEVLTNVFKERGLSKGALFPHLRDVATAAYDPHEVYIHMEQGTVEYWALTLECIRPKQSAATERTGILTVLKAVAPCVQPEVFRSLAEQASTHDTLGPVEIAAAFEKAGQRVEPEKVKASWVDRFGSLTYGVNGKAAVGPTVKAYRVTAGDLTIPDVRPDLLARMRQVNHNGQRYLIIPLEGPIRVRSTLKRSRESEQVELPEIALEQFMSELMKRT